MRPPARRSHHFNSSLAARIVEVEHVLFLVMLLLLSCSPIDAITSRETRTKKRLIKSCSNMRAIRGVFACETLRSNDRFARIGIKAKSSMDLMTKQIFFGETVFTWAPQKCYLGFSLFSKDRFIPAKPSTHCSIDEDAFNVHQKQNLVLPVINCRFNSGRQRLRDNQDK